MSGALEVIQSGRLVGERAGGWYSSSTSSKDVGRLREACKMQTEYLMKVDDLSACLHANGFLTRSGHRRAGPSYDTIPSAAARSKLHPGKGQLSHLCLSWWDLS